MDNDIKTAANAMNDRGAELDFEVTVIESDELEEGLMSLQGRNTLLGSKNAIYGEDSKPARPMGLCGCLSLAYYQPYFDVDTVDVQKRLVRALVPFKKDPTFAELALKSPDAYGPFWISTTLIFCLASCSNVASFLDYMGDTDEWTYDFSRLASAYTLIEIFLLGLPLLIWLVGKYFQVPMNLLFLVCLYGYSAIIFIPAAILCVSPIDAMDWVAMLMAMTWSLFFLLTNLWHVISEHLTKEKMLPVLAVISGAHMMWVIVMKLLFF